MKRALAFVGRLLAGLLSALVLIALMLLITYVLLVDLVDVIFEGESHAPRPQKQHQPPSR